jgi:hypothetical protein
VPDSCGGLGVAGLGELGSAGCLSGCDLPSREGRGLAPFSRDATKPAHARKKPGWGSRLERASTRASGRPVGALWARSCVCLTLARSKSWPSKGAARVPIRRHRQARLRGAPAEAVRTIEAPRWAAEVGRAPRGHVRAAPGLRGRDRAARLRGQAFAGSASAGASEAADGGSRLGGRRRRVGASCEPRQGSWPRSSAAAGVSGAPAAPGGASDWPSRGRRARPRVAAGGGRARCCAEA